MMRTSKVLPFLGVILIGVGLAAGQHHVNGYVYGAINFSKTTVEATVFIVDAGGNVVASIATGSNNVHGVVMGPRNQFVLATNYDGIVRILDPKAAVVIGTLAAFPTGYWLRDIAVDQNGDVYVTEHVMTDAIYRIDQTGQISTVAVLGDNPGSGMDIDIDTSHLLVQSSGAPDPLRLVARDGSFVTTLGTGFNARFGIAQHIPTGDVYSASCCGSSTIPQQIYVLRKGTSVASIWLGVAGVPNGIYSLKADRVSGMTQRLIAGAYWPGSPNLGPGGIYYVDITSKQISVLTTLLPTNTDIYELEILYRRNVYSVKIGQGRWDVGISIPEDKNRPYALVVSLSGVRPGVVLPTSGRRVALNPDALTFLGLTVGLAPILTGTAGVLDGNGRALAKLDVSALLPALKGVRVWFVALTIDPQSPDGFATITDPHVIQLE